MTPPVPNVPLLRELRDAIITNPEHHDNTYWWKTRVGEYRGNAPEPGQPLDCGTAMCAAGWVAYLTGMRWVGDMGVRRPNSNHTVSVDDYARRALGLTVSEATKLFASGNSQEDVLELIDLAEKRAVEMGEML
jgi:hypothetical protein